MICLGKLRLCRQERERIIDEGARDDFKESEPEELKLTDEYDGNYVVQTPDQHTEFMESMSLFCQKLLDNKSINSLYLHFISFRW